MKNFKTLQKPIIFIGTGRSGTTIISEIVMRHPELAFPSNYQNVFYKISAVNFIRVLFDNALWKIYGQKKQLNKTSFLNLFFFKPSEAYSMWNYLTGKDIDFSRGFLLDEPVSEKRIEFIRMYFSKMVKYQNRKRLALKITGPPKIGFLLKIFPDAIFINLKRNLVPTVSSFLNVEFWQTRGKEQIWWQGAYTEKELYRAENLNNPTLITAFQLKKINKITEVEVKKFQPRYIEVHYEDFVVNPKKEINRIIDFADLPPFSAEKYLDKIKIYNRNKKDIDYFSAEELEDIYNLKV